jgi:xylulokinase
MPDAPVLRPPIRNTGGGSRSSEWVQLKADVLGTPVATMEEAEPGCLGAAMLAAVGAGLLPDTRSAQTAWCRLRRVVEPDLRRMDAHAARFDRYRQLYPAIHGIRSPS